MGLRFYISNKFPGETRAAGLRTTVWVAATPEEVDVFKSHIWVQSSWTLHDVMGWEIFTITAPGEEHVQDDQGEGRASQQKSLSTGWAHWPHNVPPQSAGSSTPENLAQRRLPANLRHWVSPQGLGHGEKWPGENRTVPRHSVHLNTCQTSVSWNRVTWRMTRGLTKIHPCIHRYVPSPIHVPGTGPGTVGNRIVTKA